MTAAATIRAPETLTATITRIAYDTSRVDLPFTPARLAGGLAIAGYRHPDHPRDTPDLRRALAADIDECWPDNGDPHIAASGIEDAGWKLPGAENEWRTRRLNPSMRAHYGCDNGHGPDGWSYQGGYCKTCRAERRAAERAALKGTTP